MQNRVEMSQKTDDFPWIFLLPNELLSVVMRAVGSDLKLAKVAQVSKRFRELMKPFEVERREAVVQAFNGLKFKLDNFNLNVSIWSAAGDKIVFKSEKRNRRNKISIHRVYNKHEYIYIVRNDERSTGEIGPLLAKSLQIFPWCKTFRWNTGEMIEKTAVNGGKRTLIDTILDF